MGAMACTAAGCNRSEQPKGDARRQTAPVAVTVQPVRVEPMQKWVAVVGTLHGQEDATITAKVSGRIAEIRHDVGDQVQPGQVLAQLELQDYDLAVRQKELAVGEVLAKLNLSSVPSSDFSPTEVPTVKRAKLQADNAKAKYERGRQLHDQDPPLLSDQDFADLKTAWEVASANYDVELLAARSLLAQVEARLADLDLAKQSLMDATIRAPYLPATRPSRIGGDSYAVSSRLIAIGEYVREGTALFRLVDDDPVKLRATASERFVAQIKNGQKVRLGMEAYGQEEFWGEVSRINPQIDPANRTFEIEVLVPNPQKRLKPGAFAKAWVYTHVDPKVVFVPASAVVSFAGVNKVFTVREGKAAEIVFEAGQKRGDLVEVLAGLNGSETIVIDNLNKLANGTPVTIKGAPPGGAAQTSARP